MDLSKLTKALSHPPRVLIYGGPGIGKTTFACGAPHPVMLSLENGLPAELQGEIYTYPNTVEEKTAFDFKALVEFLNALIEQDHSFKTLIVDSIDHLESTVTNYTNQTNGWPNISHPGYGKGFTARSQNWDVYWRALDAINEDMAVVQIAHSTVIKVEDPILPAYDTHTLKLYKTETAKAIEWSDIVGYCRMETYTTSGEGGRVMATSAGERLLCTNTNPTYVAKTRYPMPAEMPLDWGTFAQYLKKTKKN